MKRQKIFLFVATLVLIASTSVFLTWLKANQRLGAPGIRTRLIAGKDLNVEIILPERAADYESVPMEIPAGVVAALPKDTSMSQRIYTAPDGFWIQMNVVLMGMDRTSIHKPQFCMTSQGWAIDADRSSEEAVRVERPQNYDLPVMKLIATKDVTIEGATRAFSGVYLYWFVADGRLTASHSDRMWWMVRDLFRTGVLQRWSYVTCFAVCAPGNEDATFERLKKFIAASAPEFQLVPRAKQATVVE